MKRKRRIVDYTTVCNIPVLLSKHNGNQYCTVLGNSFKYKGELQYYHVLHAFKLGPKYLKTIEDYTSKGIIEFQESEEDIDTHHVTKGILHLLHFLHKEGWETIKLKYNKSYQQHKLTLKRNEHIIIAYVKDRVKGKIKIKSLPFQSSLNTATLLQFRKLQP